ncbi:hypothetical protein AWC38_SpisGene23032 [Stylophora pistillata]|uniref:RNA-directed DNA polymerase from mobile element jockey n=1 Tax=Stylophora pistillata TaxID=50429 RepID=A0A2B4R997_STYPI|nr:hypothetical protein AWC38_SpisGene23032 [Stylophora pistillata]
MEALRQLPFADSSLNSSTSTNSSTGSCFDDETWSEYDALIKKHRTNIKIGHVNVDHIAGFKFFEVKYWLLEGKFDVLVLSETKLDSSFPDSQFMVTGYRMCRADRNIHGGGLMVYIRADLCFKVIKDLPNLRVSERERYKTESIVLKVRIAKKWETIVGIYRPPTSANVPQSLWKFELSSMLEAITILPVAEMFDDVNDKLYVFDCLYEDILDEHAPLKQVRIRGNQVPFMNEQWRKAIRQKNRLWKRFIRERTDTNYELYKRQRNICTSLRRKAIKTFFDKKKDSVKLDTLNRRILRFVLKDWDSNYDDLLDKAV